MKNILKFIIFIFKSVFPMVANYKDNKKIREKISKSKGVLYGVSNNENIELEDLIKMYDETFKKKDKFEDKAKTNIVSVSISITLIMGASGFLSNIKDKFCCAPWISWIIFGIFIVSVLYMLCAGILIIKMLINENAVHVVSLENMASGGEPLREDYSICIENNQYMNMIRNNYVYTSYECIRNALFFLLFALIFVIIPI